MFDITSYIIALLNSTLAYIVYFIAGSFLLASLVRNWRYTGIPASSIYVIDGDTVSLTTKRTSCGPVPNLRVRPVGFDAPELDQPFGKEAAAELRRVIKKHGGLTMRQLGTDKYDRTLAFVRIGMSITGKSLAKHMISQGLAHPTTGSAIGKYIATLSARIHARGMWQGNIFARLIGYGVVNPATFRKQNAQAEAFNGLAANEHFNPFGGKSHLLHGRRVKSPKPRASKPFVGRYSPSRGGYRGRR